MDKSNHVVLVYCLTQLGFMFFFYPGNIISSATEGHWIPIVIGMLVNILVVWAYMKGLSYFPKQDIISIYLGVGKWAAFVFLCPLVIFLLLVNIITVRGFSEVISLVFLENTPVWAISGLFISISTYMAMNGIGAIFRTGVLLAFLFLPLILFTFVISFQNVDFHYVFPLLTKNFSFLWQPGYIHSFSAFAGSFLFLGFITPYFTYSRSKMMLALAALVPFFILSVYLPILTFGQATASTFNFPFVVLVSTVHINWLMFDRVTMFLLLSLITFAMLFISLLLWEVSRILKRAMPKAKPSYLILIVSTLIFAACLSISSWQDVQMLFSWNVSFRFFTLFAIPFSILIIGLRSGRRQKVENR
ncbi:GerAB/ArcD/ProY family transporter [Paenibacillus luteus]|uniref:GerAB/ArcD/ProY family transporter n=1 Tax=Paenibacillus luteus TaxID=2545753 RepID=UPI0011435EA6|nr:GerAB/ArcD/ProY family transporter [Paenibacillus luteus]